MDALSEGQVGARVAAVDVERLGFTEPSRVPPSRPEQQQDLGARGYIHLADHRRAGGDPAPGDHAGVVPQDFFDGAGDGLRVGAQLVPRSPAAEQPEQGVPGQVGGCLVPGEADP